MREKSYVARLGALALVLTLMTTCLTGGTLAKFVTEVEGTAAANVAAWSFKAAGSGGTALTAIDMGRDTYNGDTVKDGVIAPGTTGSFDIVLDGSGSEVGIDYIVTISKSNNPDVSALPDDLKFKADGVEYTLGNEIKGTIKADAGTMEKTIKITWEWDYGSGDTAETDKNDNAYENNTWELDIKATGIQTQPTAPTT